MLKHFVKSLFVLALALIVFSACEKDNLTTNQQTGQSFFQLSANNGGGGPQSDSTQIDCFAFVYPVTVVYPGGTTEVVNSEDELWNLIDQWFDNNPNAEEEPTFAFPLSVTLEDASQQSINDEEELCELFEDCYDDEDWDDWDEDWEDEYEEEFCFELVFPLSVAFPDGTTQVAQNEDELFKLLDDWYETADPDSEACPDFVYPLEVILDDSTQVTINDTDEFDELLDECYYDYEDCFTVQFPVQLVLPDSSTISGNSEEELWDLLETWYEANPDVEEDPAIVFPLNLTLTEDGSSLQVNSEDELEEILADCYGYDPDDFEIFSNPSERSALVEMERQVRSQGSSTTTRRY